MIPRLRLWRPYIKRVRRRVEELGYTRKSTSAPRLPDPDTDTGADPDAGRGGAGGTSRTSRGDTPSAGLRNGAVVAAAEKAVSALGVSMAVSIINIGYDYVNSKMRSSHQRHNAR